MRRLVVVVGVVVGLSACAPTGWQWQRFPAFFEFGSFAGTDGSSLPWASTGEGPLRFDDVSYRWARIPLPGASAVFTITPDGHEYASTYGIYTRTSAKAQWQLLSGTRALGLSFAGKDERGNLYARTTLAASGKGEVFVRLAGEDGWAKVGVEATTLTSFVNDPIGRLYLSASAPVRLLRLEGTTTVDLAQPSALAFDAQGQRYQASLPFTVERVTDSGELELWHRLVGAGTPVLSTLLGFGRDGRFYALIGTSGDLPSKERVDRGDLVSIGAGEPQWRIAAKLGVNGDGQEAGPVSLDAYGGGFARDGSLYFGGCESGCAGGNAFSYGLFRLTLGGQP